MTWIIGLIIGDGAFLLGYCIGLMHERGHWNDYLKAKGLW